MEESDSKNGRPLRCLVVDDEPTAREGIVDFIGQVDFLTVAESCASAMQAVTCIQQGNLDLMFLDINMPHLTGLDMLESLADPPLTILTTAYSEYALEGYRLQVVDYLLKPIAFKRFYQAALKAEQAFRSREMMQNGVYGKQNRSPFLYVKQADGFQKISWENILFIESMENYVKINLKDKQLVAHQTMTALQETLPQDLFFRIHKSFLVNIYQIDSIRGGRILVGGHELPLSRHRRDELLQSVVYKNLIGR